MRIKIKKNKKKFLEPKSEVFQKKTSFEKRKRRKKKKKRTRKDSLESPTSLLPLAAGLIIARGIVACF